MQINSPKKLDVYKKAYALAMEVFELTRSQRSVDRCQRKMLISTEDNSESRREQAGAARGAS
jgi:hypothetical protein